MSYARQKGTSAEREVVNALIRGGFIQAERAPRWGKSDKGDVVGIPGLVFEVKNKRAMDLAGWVDEAEVERQNAMADFGMVVHKKRGCGHAEDWYCTTKFGQQLWLLKKAGY